MRQELPLDWVKKIHLKLKVHYGADWSRKWEGVDMADVERHWAIELGGFASLPESIAYGLTHPPAKAPTVDEFRAVCRAHRPTSIPQLSDQSRADPSVVAMALGAINTPPASSRGEWAVRVLERVVAKDSRIAPISEQFALEGLRNLGMRDATPAAYLALNRSVMNRVFAVPA